MQDEATNKQGQHQRRKGQSNTLDVSLGLGLLRIRIGFITPQLSMALTHAWKGQSIPREVGRSSSYPCEAESFPSNVLVLLNASHGCQTCL